MKTFLVFIFCLGSFFSLLAQSDDAQIRSELYQKYLKNGDKNAENDSISKAIEDYLAALVVSPDKSEEIIPKMKALFRKVDDTRMNAIKAAELASKNEKIAKNNARKAKLFADSAAFEKKKSDSANAELNKQIEVIQKYRDALYFYYDSIALAYSNETFSFIDKEGNPVERLGDGYTEAKIFDDDGWAIVKKDDIKYAMNLAGEKFIYSDNINVKNPEGTEALDLRNKDLTTFPSEIQKFKNLKILILRNNNISYLPYSMNFPKLIFLSIKNNKLENLPDSLFLNSPALSHLNLNDNYLTKIPGTISKLKKLSFLDISNNQIAELPDLGNLTELTVFAANGNKLAKLPTNFDKLTNLKEVDISSNFFLNFPEVLLKLNKLNTLYLRNNRIDSLPSDIVKLKKLEKLGIGNNFIDELPEEICSAPMLRYLDIYENNITKLPNDFLKCMQKVSLYIKRNPFELNKSERDCVKEKDIRYTEFQENNFHKIFIKYAIQGKIDKAKQLFDKIAKLDSLPSTDKSVLAFALMSLDLEQESAAVLHPDSVMVLDLEGYSLTGLSEKIDRFKNLKVIHLKNNYLHSLPKSICNLKFLEELYLNCNYISVLPDKMGDISTLKIVDLSGNSHLKTGNIFDIFQNFSTPIFITTQPSVSVTENYLTLAVPMPSAIPSNISKMKNLEILYIADNYLRDLPQNTKFPASLKELYMQGNVFTVLPESIGELRELTVLNLKKNNLETLPASIGNLKKLKQLEIEDNSLTSLPASFFDLTVSNSINYTVLVKEATNKNNLNLVNQIYEGIKNKKKLDNADYGSLSWWFFFAHNFDAAIWAGERYESEGGESVFLLSNLAMGYLYKGEYEKALEIYKKYKNTNLDSYGSDIKTGKDVFLKDLKEAEEKKIKPKKPADVRKILFFLNE